MKHAKYLLPILALCLVLTACGSKVNDPGAASPAPDTSVPAPEISQPEPEVSAPDVPAPEPSESEPPAPLTEDEKAAAREAALDYYRGTVFQVESLTEIDARAGEITFQTACSKGGVRQDPDRTISLERQDGSWTVVSEGY